MISKLRSDAALYPAFEGAHPGPGRKPKYGAKVDVRNMDAKYLQDTSIKDHLRTAIYQGQFYNKEFAFALNVVVIVKTNLQTHSQAHVILFSTDLEQAYANPGALLVKGRRYDEAVELYHAAMELDPRYTSVYDTVDLLLKQRWIGQADNLLNNAFAA